MNSMEERFLCDEKMERISELLDELVLDALLRLLQCIWDSNATFDERSNRHNKTDDMSF